MDQKKITFHELQIAKRHDVDLDSLSHEQLIYHLSQFPHNIEKIKDPSLELQMIVVLIEPTSILKISNPYAIVEDLAYTNNPLLLLGRVQNYDVEITKKHLKKYPNIIHQFKNPPLELQIEAIRSNPSLIEDIDNPHPEAEELAVYSNYKLIGLIKNQTPDLCLYALMEEEKELGTDAFCELYKSIKIVDNPDYETTFNNLQKRKTMMRLK